MTPHDLPAGFAENQQHRVKYLADRAGNGSRTAAAVLERELRDGFSTLMFDPEPGRVYDAGLEQYGEFFCGIDTARNLLDGGFVFNGRKGTVAVVNRFTNGAQLRWRPL